MLVEATVKSRQAGVALVSVLLVVVIATVLATTIVQEQRASIQTTRNFLQRGQAVQYALGGEELARQILQEDLAEGSGRDHLAETWASPELHFEFEEGEVNLQITDLQGRVNVNSLDPANSQQTLARQRMQFLIAAVRGDATAVDRMQDWIDKDTSVRAAGAEDFEYLAFEPPYRAGDQALTDVSEMRLLGLEAATYNQLSTVLTALPDLGANLNINTATPLALQSLASGLTFETAESLTTRRDEEEGFNTVAEFLQSSELAGLGIVEDGLGVQSSFFEARIVARYQDRYSFLTSVIHRDAASGSMRVIQRDFSRNIFLPSDGSSRTDD